MKDLITVVIPTYNGEKYIKECIESVQHQSFPHEIIVIDDISTDRTVEIAKSMDVKVIINEVHKGQVAAKNTGIREATGNYWLTIDHDDMLTENALQVLYNKMQESENNQIVMAKLKDFSETPEQNKFCKREAFYGILTGTTLFRTKIFEKIGFWKEGVITGDVIDLTNRLMKHNIQIQKIDFISCNRRIHSSNYGMTNRKDEYKDYAKALRERIKIGRKNNK